MRILVDVPENKLHDLAALVKKSGLSRAEIIRRAVDAYIASSREPLSAFYGLWESDGKTQDSQQYLDDLRSEWDR